MRAGSCARQAPSRPPMAAGTEILPADAYAGRRAGWRAGRGRRWRAPCNPTVCFYVLIQSEFTMEWLADPQIWLALATLTALEIVLGVHNIIFISILCGRL